MILMISSGEVISQIIQDFMLQVIHQVLVQEVVCNGKQILEQDLHRRIMILLGIVASDLKVNHLLQILLAKELMEVSNQCSLAYQPMDNKIQMMTLLKRKRKKSQNQRWIDKTNCESSMKKSKRK